MVYLYLLVQKSLVGKNIEIEHYDDTVILYLSCIEFDREIINMALTLLIYLSKLIMTSNLYQVLY